MQAGDSDSGLEGQAWRIGAADGQQPTAVGIVTTLGEPWQIVEAAGRWHLRSPAAVHRSFPVSNHLIFRLPESRWI